MRKLILSICLFAVVITTSAQLTANGTYKQYQKITSNKDTIQVFLFNGITSQTDITYTGPYNNINDIKWSKFSNGITSPSSNGQESISPEDNTGYILSVDGKIKATIWVIDYSLHKPTLTTIEPEKNLTEQCKTLNLNIDATADKLNYQTPNGFSYPLPRDFKIKYTTLKWGGTAWQPKDTTVTLTMSENIKNVPAPFCSTTYTLSGDQYADDLGLVIKKESDPYTPVAVICHETSITTTRKDVLNENERPKEQTDINNSGPLEIQFLANANEPITTFYKWEIFKDKKLIGGNNGPDLKEYRFTFSEAGDYYSKVTVSSTANTCSFSDSIKVTVSDSQIKVPNVFTPNGDGKNDEFRIAYKSIISFHCWVYNRWGRLVYEWTDPQKGWDGKIGGKDASPGAYFYVINAKGTDAKKYKLKGDINLLRGTGN